MNLFTRLKQSTRKILLGLAALTLFAVPAAKLFADNPRFNQIVDPSQGINEPAFLNGQNVTQNQTSFSDPVDANQKDLVRVKIYYHNDAAGSNGQPGDPAINTRVKLVVPNGTATAFNLSSTISADNTVAVSDGLRINVNALSSLNFVPGSVKWYPDRNVAGQPIALPNGQTGDELITTNGVLLGDIKGCWPFSGFITADVVLNPAGESNIVQSKSAFNTTQNVNATTVAAKPGDTITYTLTTKNTGNIAEANYVVTDDLRDVLQYSDIVSISDGGTMSNGIVSYPAVNIDAGQTLTHTFIVRIKDAAQWPQNGDRLLSNVYGNAVDVPVIPPVLQSNMTLTKAARNVTQNGQFTDIVRGAHFGDLIEYRVVIKNVGQTSLVDLVTRDEHDQRLEFQLGSTTLTRGGTTVAIVDDITGSGYRLSSPLTVGEEIVFTYRMRIASSVVDGDQLRNDAIAKAQNVSEVRDNALVVVERPVTITNPTIPTTPPTISPTTITPINPRAPIKPVPKKELPRTGPSDIAFSLFGIASGGATGWRYWRTKRALATAAREISVL